MLGHSEQEKKMTVRIARFKWAAEARKREADSPPESPAGKAVPKKQSRERLGVFEAQTLAALSAAGGHAHALEIAKRLATAYGGGFALPQVHVTLKRLERDEFVSSVVEDHPRPIRGGRARRVFNLEGKGARALDESTANYNALVSSERSYPKDTVHGPANQLDHDHSWGGANPSAA